MASSAALCQAEVCILQREQLTDSTKHCARPESGPRREPEDLKLLRKITPVLQPRHLRMEEVTAALANMQAELICPVCLDYLSDPVTIDCGHNFCDSCIRMSWKDLQDTFPCPVCRHPCQEKRIRANAQLGRLVDLARLLHSSSSSETAPGEEHRCEEHKQELSLFCEDDRELLCPLCAQGPAHQGHHVRPVAEAAAHHRQRLSGDIEALKKKLAKVQKLEVAQDRNLARLREDVGKQRRQLASELELLTQFVEREQEAALGRLAAEEKRLQQQLRANLEAYSDHISALKDLLREVSERAVMSEEKVLRGLGGLQQRLESLEPPAVQPLRFRPAAYSLPPLCSALSSVMQRFRERVSLDPRAAHPSLRVSRDLTSVTCVRKRPKGDADPGPWADATELVVLGREAFASGRHYWEVQVGAKPEWAVGVCTVAPSAQAPRAQPAPKRCWTLQRQDGDYLAVGAGVVPLALGDPPAALGVYLDWELGQLSFYNAADRAHLHSFTEHFAQELKPYFRVGPDCAPLSVGAGRAEEG
ncbi:tripartite motif-containing protein 75-like [Sorex araneus]|uniref:tripartite motif-containing protein 75-like n=1 Tax=Sorex araneus TaxID=42254 RepID=UPI002433DAA0|nr:tripartite motif-containing protein 75-like [Sorex araneus]